MEPKELGTYQVYFGIRGSLIAASLMAYKTTGKVLFKTEDIYNASTDSALTGYLQLRWYGKKYVSIEELLV